MAREAESSRSTKPQGSPLGLSMLPPIHQRPIFTRVPLIPQFAQSPRIRFTIRSDGRPEFRVVIPRRVWRAGVQSQVPIIKTSTICTSQNGVQVRTWGPPFNTLPGGGQPATALARAHSDITNRPTVIPRALRRTRQKAEKGILLTVAHRALPRDGRGPRSALLSNTHNPCPPSHQTSLVPIINPLESFWLPDGLCALVEPGLP